MKKVRSNSVANIRVFKPDTPDSHSFDLNESNLDEILNKKLEQSNEMKLKQSDLFDPSINCDD